MFLKRTLYSAAMKRALVCVVVAACTSSAPKMTSTPDASVDPDDVFCDPVEAIADDVSPSTPTKAPLVQWVDPFIGTGGVAWGVGMTYPGPQAPFGMARPGPDTSHLGQAASFLHCGGYFHDDDVIDGFSHFRLSGAGIADYGGVALMPTIGMTAAKTAPRGHGSRFSHASERASPGYYAVKLDDANVEVELTARERVAYHRYTFPPNTDAVVILDAAHVLADGNAIADAGVVIDPKTNEVSGSTHVLGSYSRGFGGITMYFAARFEEPFASFGTYASGALSDGSVSAQGKDVGAYARFASSVVRARVGLSLVDAAHARMNLLATTADFDAAKSDTEAAWEKRLSRAQIEARSDRDRRVFYSALYHAALMPTLASDVDGSYRGIDGVVHASSAPYFTDFSLWDTYRTEGPLLALLYPEDAARLAQSLVQMGKDAGFIPRWPIGTGESGGMLGDGGTVTLADAAARGVRGWDEDGGYALALAQATKENRTRDHLSEWSRLGYIPNEIGGATVSKTLEYAFADAALATWAHARGDAANEAMLRGRAEGWTKLYDPAAALLVPRAGDGSIAPYNALSIGGPYAEGSAWQYTFMPLFDVGGLSRSMSPPVLAHDLEQLFTRFACTGKTGSLPEPYYWPANEPSLFAGWIFALTGDSARASRWLRWTTLAHYGDGPDGLPGNDDGGTMSAFYVFASLGLGPIPGTDTFALGTPLHPRATLALPNGTLTIEAPGASKRVRFARPPAISVRQGDLPNSTLRFEMRASP